MTKRLFLVSVLVCSFGWAKEQARSMDDMQGDCANYEMKLGPEMELWKSEPLISAKSLAPDKVHSLELKPQNQVKFPVAPEKFFSKNDSKFGGVFSFKVPKDGVYKISSGSKVWFDVANEKSKTLVPTKEFEMQTQCASIFKVVTFDLQKDVDYSLQINSSAKPSSLFLITKE